MNGFITAREAAEKWNVSERQVQVWCKEGMINGAAKFAKSWAIPGDTEKPTRTRQYKPGRKSKKDEVK